MTRHTQSWVKVNAQVDGGVVPLIEALNCIPELRTMESCETDGEEVWVCFDAGTQNWQKLAEVVFSFLGPSLADTFGNAVGFEMKWSNGIVLAEMTVHKSMVAEVSQAIRELAASSRAA
jgi:hypothetical protein